MSKRNERKAFLFYASNLEVIEEFSETRQKKIIMSIINYGLADNSESEPLSLLEPVEQKVLRPILDSIDIQKRRYYNKKLLTSAISIVQEYFWGENKGSLRDDATHSSYKELNKILKDKIIESQKHDLEITLREIEDILEPYGLSKYFHKESEMQNLEKQIKERIDQILDNDLMEYLSPEKKEMVYKNFINDILDNGHITAKISDILDGDGSYYALKEGEEDEY